MQKHCRKGRIINMAAVVLVMTGIMSILTGCGAVERVKYEMSDAGVRGWEEEALEAGITSEAEEYYYMNLAEEFQETYREIYVHIMKNEDEGKLYSRIASDDFWNVYYAVLADHPEIFWLGPSAQIGELGLTGRVVSYDLETIIPKEARVSMQQQLEEAADACISQIDPGATDYQKIKYVYEYIIDTTDYDAGGADSQNIQSVLLYKKSVCAGYSKAFQYILNRMGMFCTYITGTIQDGGSHGWNLVRIDGNYYYVDVTWGDPVFVNRVEGSEDVVKNYNYLCCTEYDLFKTHVPDDWITLPQCTRDDYNYYRLNGQYYEVFDYDTIYSKLMESVWNGDASIEMKFGSSEAYEAAKREMVEGNLLNDAGQYLMEINGVRSWNYRYHADENFNLITLYWR